MSHPSLTPHAIVVRSPEPLSASVEDSLVLFSVALGKYFTLDDVSTAIWNRLEHPTAVKDLCASLQAEFEVDPAVCEADVLRFIAEFTSRGLVDVVVDRPSS